MHGQHHDRYTVISNMYTTNAAKSIVTACPSRPLAIHSAPHPNGPQLAIVMVVLLKVNLEILATNHSDHETFINIVISVLQSLQTLNK